MRYIFAKVDGDKKGEILRSDVLNIISFEFIEGVSDFSLPHFNKFIRTKSLLYPNMNNSDYHTMMNLGRALVYIEIDNFLQGATIARPREAKLTPKDYIHEFGGVMSTMIIDLDHPKNKLIKAMFIRDNKINEIFTNKE